MLRSRRVADVDAVSRTRVLRALTWAAFPGVFMGGAVAVPLSERWGPLAFVVVPVVLTGAVALGVLALSEAAGALVGALAHPDGGPVDPDFSRVDALRLRGDAEGALSALHEAVAAHPDRPEPPLRIARLLRDELARPDEALAWFAAALEAPGLAPGARPRIERERVELLRRVDDLPGALRELARMADVHAGTDHGAWASAERDHVKGLLLGGEAGRSARR